MGGSLSGAPAEGRTARAQGELQCLRCASSLRVRPSLCAGPSEKRARHRVESPCGVLEEGEKVYSDQMLRRARASHLQA